MKTVQYTFWQDGEFFIGFLNDYPDYETQGYSKDELLENLKDLSKDITSKEIPYIKRKKKNENHRFNEAGCQ
ncbi:MAG: type II toxin-antitoxin system HicB family antitoxin [Pyrinomonadaceae bacterium]